MIEPDARLELGSALALPRTLDYDVSPDGRRAVLSVALRDRALLFLTAPGAAPGRLTDGRRWDTQPRFLPDGSGVVFVAGRRPRGTDPETGALHRLALGGAPERLTPEGLEARDPAVAPDGGRIAFLGREGDGGFDLWIAEDGETRRLAEDAGPPVWSPDGTRIAATIGGALAVVPLDGPPVLLGSGARGRASWSADGSGLAWAGPHEGFEAILWRDAEAAGPVAPLVAEDRDLGQPAFRPGGGELAWIEADRGDYRIQRSRIEPGPQLAGRVRTMTRGGGVHDGLRWTGDGEAVTALYESAAFPRDVWKFPRSGGRERMSDTIFPELDVRSFSRPERVGDAFLYRPAAESAPLLVVLDGADGVEARNGFSPLVQLFAAEGYAVLAPTLPGARGRGERSPPATTGTGAERTSTRCAPRSRWPGSSRGIGERTCVFGVRYGGFLALAALARHPDLFDCGIEAMGFADLPALYRSLEPERQALLDRELGPLRGNLDLYRSLSLRGEGASVEAPLLSFHGEEMPEAPLAGKLDFLEEVRRPRFPLVELYFRFDLGRSVLRFETDRSAHHAFLTRVLEFLSLHLPVG